MGTLEMCEQEQKLHGFTFTLGYSRRMVAEGGAGAKAGTLLRLHEAAFQHIGGVPKEILYDRMKTVWLGTSEVRSSGTRCFGFRTLLGIHAAAVPTLSRPDERESGIGGGIDAH